MWVATKVTHPPPIGECRVRWHWTETQARRGDDDLRWDGVDVWPLIEGSEPATPRTLYWVGPGGRSKAVRHGDWKWITHRGGDPNGELFNLAHDPNEKRNVAARHRQRVTEFQELLTEVSAADNDRVAAE